MNYTEIKTYDIANGPYIRTSLFVSGCTHHCKNCFNPETWDFKNGKPFTNDTISLILKYMEPYYIKGLTLLGGDPLCGGNELALVPLVEKVKEKYPDKSIWCYTGYTIEEIIKKIKENDDISNSSYYQLLKHVDVLVDGPFIEELKDLSLKYCGSTNQRYIDMKQTLENIDEEIIFTLKYD